jgi:hypothetical protein
MNIQTPIFNARCGTKVGSDEMCRVNVLAGGYAVTQLIEALPYKSDGSAFDS